jgi:type I restriction enzyme, S subunit
MSRTTISANNTRLVKLGEVLKVQNGFAFDSGLFNDVDQGMPIVRIRDLARGYSETYYSGDYKQLFVVKVGDYLIGMDGEFRCYQWRGPDALLNQRVCRLQDFTSDVLPTYIFYGINAHLAAIEARTDFVTVKHLSSKQIENITIPLPPLDEQHRIVSILDEAEALRQLRARADERMADFIPALFNQMFGDPATNPKGWVLHRLRDLLDSPPQNGLYVPQDRYEADESENGIEMVHMSDLFYGIVERGHLKRVRIDQAILEKYSINCNDLLVARRSLNYEGAAKPCLIPETNKPLVFESSMIRITPNPMKLLPIYLFYYLSNERARLAHVLKYVTQATISGINQDGLKSIEVLLPPLALQHDFAARVVEARALQDQQARSRARLEEGFQALLHRAFNGEL